MAKAVHAGVVRQRQRRAARGQLVTREQLYRRARNTQKAGYKTPKWIEFCIDCMDLGLTVRVYEAQSTRSKYVYLTDGDRTFKVRFSNHPPNETKQITADSDFYVGVSNKLVTTTADALAATRAFFGLNT